MVISTQAGITSDGEPTLCAPERRAQVAALKRVFDLWALDSEFHDAYLDDPSHVLAKTGLNVDPRAVALLLLRGLPDGDDRRAALDALPETYIWFADLMEGRVKRNMATRANDLPCDSRFRDWNLRQQRRCEREMGPRARLMMHYPVTFELSLGCSLQCPFCALSADKLKGVFRHTEENAALWRDVLTRLHRIVGDAAGRALCYYATEPLDNPDYELFLEDFFCEFKRVPQTTTAAATRNIERTRRLLRWGLEADEHFDRISVLSRKDLDALLAAFSPEELLFCDLLPQFEEAPFSNFIKAGRNHGSGQGAGDTIACVSGFVVNMWERSVRLVTPVTASADHPTGELIYERAVFTDGAEFERSIRGMMDRHMHKTLGLKDLLA